MTAYAALGRRSRALVEAAGIEPSMETARLQARILAGGEVVAAA